MARPQSPDYDQRKQRILDTAAAIFADGGYHKASVSQIARKCDISKALIYHYFPSKQDILYHALIDYVRLLEETALKRLAAGMGPAETFGDIIRDYLGLYESAADRHSLLVGSLEALEPAQRREVSAVQDRIVKIFGELADQISPASLDVHQLRGAVSMLIMGMMNWTYIWFDPTGPVDSARLAGIIVRMLQAGLVALDDELLDG